MASAIGQSTDYDNNYSNKTYATKIIAESLTDGTATFSGGTITNLIPPTDPQDAITKGFVNGLVTASPPVNSVQYNNLVFAGSANLTFVSNILSVNGTINDGSGISIVGGTISGLNDPIASNQVATKSYVDSFNSTTTNTYIQSDVGVVYTTSQMLNAAILRNLVTYNNFGVSLTDTTPTAAQFIAAKPTAEVGFAARFRIMNDNPDANQTTVEGRDRFVLTINPGTGVTFYPSDPFNIRRAYMLDAYIVFTNVVVPAVTIYINRCSYSGPTIYLPPSTTSGLTVFENTVDYINYNSMQLTGNLFWNLNNPLKTATNYSYTTSDIKNQMIIRNPSGAASDTFGSIINPLYMNQMMVIQNPSAFNVVLNGQTSIWGLTPNPITITPGKQSILALGISALNIIIQGSYYNYGIYNTSGGTGSGMTVHVTGLATSFNLTNIGSTYTPGDYTTTNLTTPSATGLVVAVTNVGVTGDIDNIADIVNFLDGGYQNGDIIQINSGDNTGTIQLIFVNRLNSGFIVTLGNGAYLSTDILNISGPGTGANAQIALGSFLTIRSVGLVNL
jgi:hypothetical protein